MIIDTAEECGGRILTNIPEDQMSAAWVLVDEGSDVVDKPGNKNERSLSSLLLDYNVQCGQREKGLQV